VYGEGVQPLVSKESAKPTANASLKSEAFSAPTVGDKALHPQARASLKSEAT
jgi:hypothetical protein